MEGLPIAAIVLCCLSLAVFLVYYCHQKWRQSFINRRKKKYFPLRKTKTQRYTKNTFWHRLRKGKRHSQKQMEEKSHPNSFLNAEEKPNDEVYLPRTLPFSPQVPISSQRLMDFSSFKTDSNPSTPSQKRKVFGKGSFDFLHKSTEDIPRTQVTCSLQPDYGQLKFSLFYDNAKSILTVSITRLCNFDLTSLILRSFYGDTRSPLQGDCYQSLDVFRTSDFFTCKPTTGYLIQVRVMPSGEVIGQTNVKSLLDTLEINEVYSCRQLSPEYMYSSVQFSILVQTADKEKRLGIGVLEHPLWFLPSKMYVTCQQPVQSVTEAPKSKILPRIGEMDLSFTYTSISGVLFVNVMEVHIAADKHKAEYSVLVEVFVKKDLRAVFASAKRKDLGGRLCFAQHFSYQLNESDLTAADILLTLKRHKRFKETVNLGVVHVGAHSEGKAHIFKILEQGLNWEKFVIQSSIPAIFTKNTVDDIGS